MNTTPAMTKEPSQKERIRDQIITETRNLRELYRTQIELQQHIHEKNMLLGQMMLKLAMTRDEKDDE